MLSDSELFGIPPKTAPKDAKKDGKPTVSLLPQDILMEYVVAAYEEGLIKYERESWRRGFVVSELIDAERRHVKAFFERCEDYDLETERDYGIKKHHIAGAIFSLLSILHTLKYHPHLDDRRDPATGDLLHEYCAVIESPRGSKQSD